MLNAVNRSGVSRGMRLGLVAAITALAGPAAAQGRGAASSLPQLPGASDDTADSPAAPPPADAPGARVTPPAGLTPAQLYERVRRGVVALERNGIPVAIGTVLAGDGRILTSLSGLGGVDGADVRYADGTVVHARMARSDRAADLALLVPQSNTWTDGLSASEVDPSDTELRAMLPARGAHIGPAGAGIKGTVDAHTRAGEALLRMLDVDVRGVPVVGAPLLDVAGSVVAVLVRECKGAALDAPSTPSGPSGVENTPASGAKALAPAPAVRCQPVVVGAPVSAIRSFLTRPAPSPWLGIRGEPQAAGGVRGVRVVAIAPSSPAEKAALKASDVIVAVDGTPIDTPETLAAVIGRHAPGDSVKLLVFGQDKFREAVVALRSAPSSS
jgi:serine protease Do